MSGLFGTLRDRFRDHLAAVPDGGVGDPEPFLAALGATDFAPAEPAQHLERAGGMVAMQCQRLVDDLRLQGDAVGAMAGAGAGPVRARAAE